MSEPDFKPVLSYGQVRSRRRMWIALAALLIILGGGGVAVYFKWDWVLTQYHRRQAFDALSRTPLPTRRYIMNDPKDALSNISRMRTDWLVRNGPFVTSNTLFKQMILCDTAAPLGVQSLDIMRYPVFIGELRSPAGHRRFMLVNFGREGYDENDNGPNALPHMICQLYSSGSLLNPTLTPVALQPSADPATRAVSTIRGNWQVIQFAKMGRTTKLETTATTCRPGEPGKVRVPIWFDGQADELLITVQDNDSIIAKRGSGGDLPWQINVRDGRQPSLNERP